MLESSKEGFHLWIVSKTWKNYSDFERGEDEIRKNQMAQNL